MISKITKEQEEKIPVYLSKWIKYGYRTENVDHDKAREAVYFLYEKIMKKAKPKYVIFLDSPMACQLAYNLIRNTKYDEKIDSQIHSQLHSQLRSQLNSQLHSQLNSQLRSQLDSQLDSQLNSQLRSQIRSQIHSQLSSQLDSQLRSQIHSQLSSQLDSQLRSQKLDYIYNYINIWGWGNYYGFYDYVLNEIFPEKKEDFKLFLEFAEKWPELHYYLPFKDIVFVSDFPQEINLNKTNQLHADLKPALLYRDIYSIYKLNGINVSKEIVEISKDKITKKMITQEKNADSRREIIRKIGNDRLLELLDYKTLDKMDEYELISFDIGDGRVRLHIKMTCPSTKLTHLLGVPVDIKTCKVAMAFVFNQKEWKRPILEDGISRKESLEYFDDGQVVFRHGDVNFKKYSGEINEINELKSSGIIHKGNNNNHEYISGAFDIQDINGKKIVVVIEESTIGHNEHGEQIHPQGIYEVSIAQEFNHWENEARQVLD